MRRASVVVLLMMLIACPHSLAWAESKTQEVPSAPLGTEDLPSFEMMPTEVATTEPLPDGVLIAASMPCADCEEPHPQDRWLTPKSRKPIDYELGGQFRVEPNSSNFFFHTPVVSDDEPGDTFSQQRMRLWLTVRPNERVEGYIQMEVGNVLWGDDFEFPKTYIPFTYPDRTDQVGIELRRGWLAYTGEENGKVRIGILDWHDQFDDTLASSDYDFNVAGVDYVRTFEEWHNTRVILGAFVLFDQTLPVVETPDGNHDAVLLTIDVDRPLSETTSVGGSLYGIIDDGEYSYPTSLPYQSSWDMWIGVRARTQLSQIPLRAFLLLNPGGREDFSPQPNFEHFGWAWKLGTGPIALGKANLFLQSLYSSGDSNPGVGNSSEFRTVGQGFRDNFGAQGYWSFLHLTSPNAPSDVNDLGVSLQNRGLGLFTSQAMLQYPLCSKLSATSSAGWLWSTAENPVNGGVNLGPELAHMFTYNFGGGLVADFGAAYLFTGNFYRAGPEAPSPENLFELFARVQLEF